uniref:Methyltransferase type 11 domain-containing protein n=1 Tax=Amblyomma maculatum TaxID=34609 RepID=G3MR83_AMBMU
MAAIGILDRLLDFALVVALGGGGAVLLVPLLLSERVRQWYFARLVSAASRLWRGALDDVRRDTIAALDEIESSDPTLRAEGALRVLEIGAGFGANFELIRRKVKYWNLDPNPEFKDGFLKNIKAHPKVELEHWVTAYGEDMRGVPDHHFDAVIVTHLLCSVDSAEKVLQECRRVLVKEGRLLFVEHVAQPQGSIGRLLQRVLTPFWRLICSGCCLDRDTGDLIRGAGFAQVHMQEISIDMPVVLTRHVYGYAVA